VEISAQTGSAAYRRLLMSIEDAGQRTAPRGIPATELRNVTLLVKDPAEVHVLRTTRRPSAVIAATEATQLIAGVSSLEQLDLASGGRFSKFALKGRLRGAYGPRAYAQLSRLVTTLTHDPDSRQAVASVWRGDEGAAGGDVPCTLSYQFFIRDGKLELRTSMRSNDAWLGLPYDLEITRCLLLTMTGALGLPPGPYTHTVGSAHIYDGDAARVKEVIADGLSEQLTREPIPPFAPLTPAAVSSVLRWQLRTRAAERLVTQRTSAAEQANPWHAAHVPVLPDADQNWETCDKCRYVTLGPCQECAL
jgi:hypothetical protein